MSHPTSSHVVLLSIPALRATDLQRMPRLSRLVEAGAQAKLAPSFPALTCPVQAAMTTGCSAAEHGVVANGFYWPDRGEVEMWTAGNDCIERPQIWDLLHEQDPGITSAVWFALHSKQCGADLVCTPAPIHNPDGSESLWCYTRPEPLYGELRDSFGHFPLQHFWGPLANIQSSRWIVDSAIHAAKAHRPNFFYVYLPHLDYAAQKTGPDSDAALAAVDELDETLGRLAEGFADAYDSAELLWLVASEYVIRPVDHVAYPNRVLREAGLLAVRVEADGEHLDVAGSRAWALVDHQLAHVFVKDQDAGVVKTVRELFAGRAGIAQVLTGRDLARRGLDHPRSGQVVLVSAANSWQAYYWWQTDDAAPAFAQTVDIHRKPGYDPVELFWDRQAQGVPLDATLVQGSHGAPTDDGSSQGVLLASKASALETERPAGEPLADTDVAGLVLRQFSRM